MPADCPEPSADPCPPLSPPLLPPLAPPMNPLKCPNLLVIACTLGVITAEIRLWKLLMGFGDSIPASLFLAMFCLSSWSMNRVLASIRLSIFYGFRGEILFTGHSGMGRKERDEVSGWRSGHACHVVRLEWSGWGKSVTCYLRPHFQPGVDVIGWMNDGAAVAVCPK